MGGATTTGSTTRRMRSIFVSTDNASPMLTLKNRIALRPPRTVKSVLTTLLDQLTVSQRMLMKTASVIGPVFEEELLRSSCPIKAHLSRFAYDLDELERLSMIRRVENFVGGVPSNVKSPISRQSSSKSMIPSGVKVKFEFCYGFMQDVIRSQMLCIQLDKLQTRISECREQHQKELRHKFFEKANGSLNRPLQVQVGSTMPLPPNNRAITPTKFATKASKGDERIPTISALPTVSSSSWISSTLLVSEDRVPSTSPLDAHRHSVRKPISTFVRLKTGTVYVKKQSSVFAHINIKGLANGRMWKKRYAVLQNARLLLQYDEMNGSQPRQGTSLFLKGAKVSACDPEVAAKINCFQVEVNEWTKGKYLMSQRRFFVIAVESEAEVENWVYMVRYAIESLEN